MWNFPFNGPNIHVCAVGGNLYTFLIALFQAVHNSLSQTILNFLISRVQTPISNFRMRTCQLSRSSEECWDGCMTSWDPYKLGGKWRRRLDGTLWRILHIIWRISTTKRRAKNRKDMKNGQHKVHILPEPDIYVQNPMCRMPRLWPLFTGKSRDLIMHSSIFIHSCFCSENCRLSQAKY